MKPKSHLGVPVVLSGLLFLTGSQLHAQQGSTDKAMSAADLSPTEKVAMLENKLTVLENKIQLLEDAKAVKNLQRAYGYYLDKAMVDDVADLFADDPNASIEIGGRGVYVGKARIREFLRALMGEGLKEGQLNNHFIMQGVVHVDPDGHTAKGRWRALIQSGQQGESAEWAEGPYENVYVKENGVWKIQTLHWYTSVISPYAPGWHLKSYPMPGPLKDLPPDRPPSEVYESYPGAYLPPYHYKNPVSGK